MAISDARIFAVMAGGGQSDAILHVDSDNGSNVGANLARMFQDNPAFNHLSDLSFDVGAGVYFVVDSDGNSINRILRGNISDLVTGNPSPSLVPVFATDGMGEIIPSLEIDTDANHIYWLDGDLFGDFEGGWELHRANYDGTGDTVVAVIDTENVDPNFGFPGGVGDFAVYAAGQVAYVVSSSASVDGLGNATVAQNHILKIDLTGNDDITVLGVGAGDGTDGYEPGRLDATEGQIIAIDVDQRNGDIYFITQGISATDHGGIFKYAPLTDTLTEIWNQPSNSENDSLQPFPTTNIISIEVDEVAGKYYVSTSSDTDTAAAYDGTATDEGGARIFVGDLTATGVAPTPFVSVFEPTANGAALGMEIDYAPTITLIDAGASATEAAGSPSPAGPAVDVASNPVIADVDSSVGPGEGAIKGATVAITTGFTAGDVLGYTGSGGVTGIYSALTGVLTLTGDASFATYQTVLDSVTFVLGAGDNPTAYGANTGRTISFTVTDGLVSSDPATATLTVSAVNDAPVNTVPGAAASGAEDSAIAITGLAVSDVDANPTADDLTVTLQVVNGTLDISTTVAGGLTAGQVTGDNTGTLVLTGTQAEINATLAAAGGLAYQGAPDSSAADTLTIVTSDGGATGTPGALSDTDTLAITVNAVADIADDTATTNEDTAANILVLGNDTFEGVPAITALGAAAHGVVSLDNNGTAGDTTDDFIVYLPDADYHGADSFTYTVTSGGSTETATVDVTVSSVADAVDDALTTDEDTAITANVLTGTNGASADGFDDSGAAVTSVTQGAHGAVTFAADGAVTYTPSADYNGVDSFTYTVTSGGSTETASVNVTVAAVNDAPVVVAPNSFGGALEDAALAIDFVSFSDPDAGAATVQVTLGAQSGLLTATSGGGVTVTGSGSGLMGLSGSLADINAFILASAVTFTPPLNSTADVTLTTTIDDNAALGSGGALSDSATTTLSFTPVNDAPAGTDGAISATESTPYVFAAADFGFTDPNDSPADLLDAVIIATLPGAGTLYIDTDGGDPTNGAAVTAGQAVSAADIDAGHLVYAPPAGASGAGVASFFFQVRDDGGVLNGGVDTDASTNTLTIDIDAVNVAPAIGNLGPAASGLEQVFGLLDGDVTVADADLDALNGGLGNYAGATLTIARQGGVNAEDGFDFASSPEFSAIGGVIDNSADGRTFATYAVSGGQLVITFTSSQGPATTALVDDLLQHITYRNGSDTPPASVTLDYTFDDGNSGAQGPGGALSANGQLTVNLTSVNDAPSGADATLAVAGDTSYTFDPADFGFADVDGDGFAAVRFTSLPGAGTLLLNGAPVAAGASVQATDIAIGMLTFKPVVGDYGPGYASLTFQVQDDGGTANGGINLDATPNTLTFDVAPGSTPPEGADSTILLADGASYTLKVADFGFDDSADHSADAFVAVQIVSLPSDGGLTLNGVAVSLGQQVSVADVASGGLRFTPFDESSGVGEASFDFAVIDNGLSGRSVDPTPNTLTFTTPNDAPVNTAPSAIVGAPGAGVAITGLSVSDADAGASPLTVQLSVSAGTLAVAVGPGVTVGNSGSAFVTLTGAQAALNAVLAAAGGVVFTPADASAGEVSLTIRTDDGGANGAGGDLNDVDVVRLILSSNLAPVVDVSDATIAAHPGAVVLLDPAISLTDADSATLASVQVAITGGFASGEDVLGFTSGGGAISGAFNPATGVLTLSAAGGATPAQFEAALRAVTYQHLGDDAGAADREITITANDGLLVSAPQHITVDLVEGTTLGTLKLAFENILRIDPDSAAATDPTIPLPGGGEAPNPTAAEAAQLADLAHLVDTGGQSLDQALATIAGFADDTTSVATLSYQFFTGLTPSAAGLDYLVHGDANANDLSDPYFAQFNMGNRYINFAVNLGVAGDGHAAFEAAYGDLTLAQAMAQAYSEIFGFAPAAGKIAEILDADVGGQTRADYLAYYGGDGLDGLGTKAAAVGFLLSVAEQTDQGPYAEANANFLADLADGHALHHIDLLTVYDQPVETSIGLVGQGAMMQVHDLAA